MSRDDWQALVAKARAVDMFDVLRAHGAGELRKQRLEHVGPCPVCGTGNDRFAIKLKDELFNCRCCGRGGKGAIDLEMFLTGCDFVTAVKSLTGVISLSGQRSPAAQAAAAQEKHKAEAAKSDAEQHAKARWLWSRRQPASGTLVERYLAGRGYSGAIPPTIGFVPASGDYAPAMIAAYAVPIEGEPGELVAPRGVDSVHITSLLPDGSDRVRTGKGDKRTIGRTLGRPIVVSAIGDGLSLVITEGIEDALAYAAVGYAAWAAGSAPFFAALADSIPDCITTVIIERHPDATAERGVARLAERLRERPVRPPQRKPRLLRFDSEGQLIPDDRPVEFYPAERPIEIIIREARS
jgi:CHC2 zinc finger